MTFDSDYEPWFEPPGWIIGPIWLVLYTILAISFTMMLAKREAIPNSNLVIGLFVIQMIANLMWPNVFNSAEYLASFLLIVVMAVFTAIYAYMIYDHAKEASMLVWPYIAWVCFAGLINIAYYLNAR
tara:strand:- start:3777 stop:4157 length:381 start_codon:yes stop_codon:yes gene_type:complete